MKYANYDIENGDKLLKIGITNIINSLLKGDISSHTVHLELSMYTIVGAIEELIHVDKIFFGMFDYVTKDSSKLLISDKEIMIESDKWIKFISI